MMSTHPSATLSVHEVLREEGVVRVDSSMTVSDRGSFVGKEPWERQYMLTVSFFGGLWVLGRLVEGWTFDTEFGGLPLAPTDW